MQTQVITNRAQFDPQADAYLSSAVHAGGADLAFVEELLMDLPAAARAIDVGCGAGHLAFAFARRLREVTACDPAPSMLATVRAAAVERGVGERVSTCEAAADALPFATASFDVVGTRYSAHHWCDLPAALRELRRVLRPGGRLLVVDLLGEDQPLADTWLQAIELLRDPGHVRDRSFAEWAALLQQAGFAVDRARRFRIELEFASWIARMRTPPELAAAIRTLQSRASHEVHAALSIQPDGSFSAWTGVFSCSVPGVLPSAA